MTLVAALYPSARSRDAYPLLHLLFIENMILPSYHIRDSFLECSLEHETRQREYSAGPVGHNHGESRISRGDQGPIHYDNM